MEVKWHNHGGKKILICDYRGAKTSEDMIKVLRDAFEVISKSGEPVHTLDYYEGTYASRDFMNEANKLGKEHRSQMGKEALLGITGIKKILVKAYIKFTGSKDKIQTFENETDAMDWLVA